MSEKKTFKIKIIEQPTCEKCGKLIYQNERIRLLYMKIYHATCGYNN